MKKYLSIFAFAVMALVCLSSCGNDDDNTPAPPSNSTTGVAMRKGDISVKWVQLWKDGPKFAEYNVGASSVTQYGGLYNWGSSKDNDGPFDYNEGDDVLTGADDTATNLWGNNWRMPRKSELNALLANCNIEWTDDYKESGKAGQIFTGKGDYASNSIFLPAAGEHYNDIPPTRGLAGYYRASTPSGSNSAFILYFYLSDAAYVYADDYRFHGYSVRAVLAE